MSIKSNSSNFNLDFNLAEIMHYIDPKRTRVWAILQNQHLYYPKTVLSKCPFCDNHASFDTFGHQFNSATKSIVMGGNCNVCGGKVKFYAIEYKTINDKGEKNCDEIWMLPKPSTKEVNKEIENAPVRIFKAYKEAIDCFNGGIWSATLSACRRTMEGIQLDLFKTEEKVNKFKNTNFDNKIENEDDIEMILSKPAFMLSRFIKQAGNKGAHFDVDDPDKEMAELGLKLTENILIYFYVLPKEASDLKEKIKILEGKVINT